MFKIIETFRTIKRVLIRAVIGCVGYGLYKLLKTDEAQNTLFDCLGEDTYLSLLDKVRLVGDLLGWPIHFVKALLP